jgi:hypothetical protein
MKENRVQEEQRQEVENQEARRIACLADTLLVIKPVLAALDLNAVLRSLVLDFCHDLESKDMKSTHRIHDQYDNGRLTKYSLRKTALKGTYITLNTRFIPVEANKSHLNMFSLNCL